VNAKRARLVALAGVIAAIGSCVPLGGAVRDAFTARPAQTIAVSDAGTVSDARLALTPDRPARLVLRLRLRTDAPRARADARIPVTLELRAGDGTVVSRHQEVIDVADAGARRTRGSGAGSGDGLELRYEFPRFTAPPDGAVYLDAEVGGDAGKGTAIVAKTLELRPLAPDRTGAVIVGVFMLIGGWVTAVVGVAGLIAGATAAPVVPHDGGAAPSRAARRIAALCHLAGFAGYLLPFANVVVPLVLWLMKRDDPYVDRHGREALNFQLSVLVYILLAFALLLILIGLLMLPLLALFHVGMMIAAAVAAAEGRAFRYPLTVRFLRG
jgi:uncharacterized Tic20 family protein